MRPRRAQLRACPELATRRVLERERAQLCAPLIWLKNRHESADAAAGKVS